MKYLFIYYTGTYNTRFLTNKIKEKLVKNDDLCDLVEINCQTPVINCENYDMVGLGFPIYGFNSPLPFNKYLRKLKFKKGQKFFIYKNSGETMEMNNSASRIPLNIMKQNGCEFMGEYHFIMPYNIHFEFDKDFIREILDKDKKLIEILAYNLKNEIVHKINSNFFLDAGAFFVSVQKIGGGLNTFFYNVDKDKCVLCKKCVENCPEKNIFIKEGQIAFGSNCDMCMRCSFYCPNKAITIGMLENWRVTNYYNLEELWNMGKPEKPYITCESKGFYKCFIKSFLEIDDEYQKIMAYSQHSVNMDAVKI